MKKTDVCYSCDGVKFNFRVSCVISSNGKFLLHKKKKDSFWNLIGGRVSLGESSIDAVRREIKEEIGCSCSIKSLANVSENFFTLNNTVYHEILMIFYGELEDDIKEENIESDIEIKWFSREEIEKLDIRPKYTKNILKEKNTAIEWTVNNELE